MVLKTGCNSKKVIGANFIELERVMRENKMTKSSEGGTSFIKKVKRKGITFAGGGTDSTPIWEREEWGTIWKKH